MADDLKKTATQVDRWIISLKKLMNPTMGTVRHSNVRERKRELEDRWKVYESLYDDTTFDDANKDAAEADFTDRMDRYLAAADNACELLDSTSSEAESVRGRSNSTSSQVGDDTAAAPSHLEAAVKNAEYMISGQIKGLEEMVEEQNPTVQEVTTWKNKHSRIMISVVEDLNQLLYLRWSGSDAANKEDIHNKMKTSVDKFMIDLNKVERYILKKGQ